MKVLEGLRLELAHYTCDNCFMEASTYANGRLGLTISALVKEPDYEYEEPIAVATINIPEAPCPENEIWVKDYSENEGMVKNLVNWGVIEPMVRASVRSGFVIVDRYALTPAFMLKLSDQMIQLAKKARGL